MCGDVCIAAIVQPTTASFRPFSATILIALRKVTSHSSAKYGNYANLPLSLLPTLFQ